MKTTNNNTKLTDEQILNQQIGEFVGESLVRRYVPCLSIDQLQTNTVVKVDYDDELVYRQYEKEMWVNGKLDSDKFKRCRNFNKVLEKRYLPAAIKCYLPPYHITDVEYFMKGVYFGIWDSDISPYNVDVNELPIVEDKLTMTINLYLHLEGKET
jgi:hypothetical protein